MRMYEFNLWDKQTLKEKIVREFSNDEGASAFVNEKWKDKNLLFTWAPLTGYKYNDKAPVRIPLSDEEMQMKKKVLEKLHSNDLLILPKKMQMRGLKWDIHYY